MDAAATWDRYLELEYIMHMAPTRAEREQARWEKLQMEILATRRAYAALPSPVAGDETAR